MTAKPGTTAWRVRSPRVPRLARGGGESRARGRVCSELFQQVAPATGARAPEKPSREGCSSSFHFLPFPGGVWVDNLDRSDLYVPCLPSC